MAEITVGYFLEDVGQEVFLQALVVRIAQDVGLDSKKLRHDARSTTGGKGRVITELRKFLRDVQSSRTTSFDILVIAIDGNCQGYLDKRKELQSIVERSGYNDAVVYAIPDPHIERWYLEDAVALAQAIGADINPNTPRYKCDRGRYKNALREAFKQASILPPLGGIEYAADIVRALNFYAIGKADAGFKHFEAELRHCLTTLARSDHSL